MARERARPCWCLISSGRLFNMSTIWQRTSLHDRVIRVVKSVGPNGPRQMAHQIGERYQTEPEPGSRALLSCTATFDVLESSTFDVLEASTFDVFQGKPLGFSSQFRQLTAHPCTRRPQRGTSNTANSRSRSAPLARPSSRRTRLRTRYPGIQPRVKSLRSSYTGLHPE